jgi:O-antigen/teichoic acid export membrane protein
MTLKQKAVKGVIWSAIESWGGHATQLLTFLVLARLLTPETFGLVSMSNIFIHFVQALLGAGFTTAIVQREEIEPEHLDTAFWANLGIGIILTSIGFGTASLFSELFDQPAITPIIQCLSFTVLVNSLSGVQIALLNRQLNFKRLAALNLIGQILGSAVSITLALIGWGVWSQVVQTIVSSSVSLILLWKISHWRPGLKVSKRHFKELLSFGVNVVGIGILTFFSLRADDFMIGYYLGPMALGYYTVAYKLLVTVTQLLGEVTSKVALPIFSRLQSEPEKLRQAFYTSTRLINTVSIPSFVGMAVLAPEIINGLFGSQWEPSIPVMQVLSGVGIIALAFRFCSPVFMAMGKPSWDFLVALSTTVLRVVGFSIAAQWGIVAVASSIIICSFPSIPIRLWMLSKLIKLQLQPYLEQYFATSISTLIMVATILVAKYFMNDLINTQIAIFAYISIGILAYLTAIFFISHKTIQQILDLLDLKIFS